MPVLPVAPDKIYTKQLKLGTGLSLAAVLPSRISLAAVLPRLSNAKLEDNAAPTAYNRVHCLFRIQIHRLQR